MPDYLPFWWWKWWQGHQQPKPAPTPAPIPHSSSLFRWMHQDRDLTTVGAAALQTAKRGTWMTLDKKNRARQFRAFVVMSLRIAPLSWRQVPLGQLGPHLYSTPERNAAGSAIARTLVLLAPDNIRPGSDIVTNEGDPTQGTIETGIIHAVTILLVTVVAIAAAYLGGIAVQSIHAINFDDEITKRLLAAQARSMEILSLHVERERIAGHELPFDETERSMLLALEDVQRRLATQRHRPLPSPFQGATELVKATTSFLPMALLVFAAFFLIKHHDERRS
ncbi:hypothetical protein [Polyangium sp. y55x31]|uniref:hypothetical protein n=1 Tax=Polyangium sp. y55x31 TaxID=3042688 RepID=UPI002482DF46|nr:hypothetical protein [Polyangium sp. y55x31]MDI1484364.1 hypothetical protein [Polyangium sp. y55x31]